MPTSVTEHLVRIKADARDIKGLGREFKGAFDALPARALAQAQRQVKTELRGLTTEAIRLNRELAKVKEGTAEWKRFNKELEDVKVKARAANQALATLDTAAYTFAAREPVNGLYTFGQPRVGDLAFCTQSETHFGDIMFRFVNDEDIVTRVPPRVVPGVPLPSYYGHTGQLRFFEANGALHSDDHWWNAFLLDVEVGFANMKAMLAAPVADHSLDSVPGGYLDRIEQYLLAGQYPL